MVPLDGLAFKLDGTCLGPKENYTKHWPSCQRLRRSTRLRRLIDTHESLPSYRRYSTQDTRLGDMHSKLQQFLGCHGVAKVRVMSPAILEAMAHHLNTRGNRGSKALDPGRLSRTKSHLRSHSNGTIRWSRIRA
jgi:hypothetical protein